MKQKRTTFFEKALLIVGLAIGLVGFYAINTLYKSGGSLTSYDMLITVFLWLILLFLIIITATSENEREEAHTISTELHEETRLMKELIKEQVIEVKLLRKDLSILHQIDKDIKKK
jgi:high-affinity K+ transport system ATPase subunit B